MKLKSYLAKGKEAPPGSPTGRETDWMLVDRLRISSGTMWIGDPGFSWAECRDGSGCTLKLPEGTYRVEAKAQEYDGPRLVTRMRAYLDESDNPKPGKKIGDAGTDSGQIGVCDPKLLMAAFAAAFDNDEDEVLESLESAFDDGCGVYYPKPNAAGCLVYVPSGFGDGGNAVFELRSGGRTVGLETEFIATDKR